MTRPYGLKQIELSDDAFLSCGGSWILTSRISGNCQSNAADCNTRSAKNAARRASSGSTMKNCFIESIPQVRHHRRSTRSSRPHPPMTLFLMFSTPREIARLEKTAYRSPSCCLIKATTTQESVIMQFKGFIALPIMSSHIIYLSCLTTWSKSLFLYIFYEDS